MKLHNDRSEKRLNDDDDEDAIEVPLYTLTLTYGISRSGERICAEQQDNHQEDGEGIPMMERLGMLGMAQQCATLDVMLNAIHEQSDEDSGQ